METRALGVCPVCGETRFSPVFAAPEPLFPSGKLSLERCLTCDLVFLTPHLTGAAIETIQDADTFYEMEPDQVEEHLLVLDGMVASLERSVARRGRLLDIGCNRGFLLEAAKRRGWDVVGVELSSVAASRARQEFGLLVHEALESVGGQEFDLIVAWHVLEHTLDPVAFLWQAGSLLATDGILALQVPSFSALATFAERGMFSSLVCAVHNFYFEPGTLANVIAEAGHAVVDLREDDIMLTATCIAASHATPVREEERVR